MARAIADLYQRVRHMGPELVKFGVVGGIGAVVDLGGAAVLHSSYHVEPLEAKAISITAATVVTYAGSRFWTFRHRENQAMHREAVLFIVLNVIGLIIAEAVIGITTYALGLKSPLAYNAASVLGTGLGTIFRFYAYRKWVFLAPAEQSAPTTATGVLPENGLDYAPWELDPSFFDQPSDYSRQMPLEEPLIQNERMTAPLVTAAAHAREATAAQDVSAGETAPREGPSWEEPVWDSSRWENSTPQEARTQENVWELPRRDDSPWDGPRWEEPEPSWDAPSALSSDGSASAGQRAPGRHRKPR